MRACPRLAVLLLLLLRPHAQATGGVPTDDMRRTFNMGVGIVLVVDPSQVGGDFQGLVGFENCTNCTTGSMGAHGASGGGGGCVCCGGGGRSGARPASNLAVVGVTRGRWW